MVANNVTYRANTGHDAATIAKLARIATGCTSEFKDLVVIIDCLKHRLFPVHAGKVYVFVVNHYRRNTDAVEKFLFVESSLSLEHIQTYTSDVFGQ